MPSARMDAFEHERRRLGVADAAAASAAAFRGVARSNPLPMRIRAVHERGRVRFDVHRLVCLGLSHRTAPVELRERIGSLGLGVERCPAVVEHAVLQTCYRVELYAQLTVGLEAARDELVDVLPTAHDVSEELLLEHLYVHAGEDLARHLYPLP